MNQYDVMMVQYSTGLKLVNNPLEQKADSELIIL